LPALYVVTVNTKAQEIPSLKVKISVSPEVKNSFLKGGRLIVHLKNELNGGSGISIGVTPKNWDPTFSFIIDTKNKDVMTRGLEMLLGHIGEKFYGQVIYKQNIDDAGENVPGNLNSDIDSFVLSGNATVGLTLNDLIPLYTIVNNKFVKTVVIKSKYLSEFSGRPRYLRASILLPSGYFDHPGKSYPICYRAAGLNGRYNAVNEVLGHKDFSDWWFSKSGPQIIYVFLDSNGPYGDTYQVDSDNNGPCGKALTEELIPEVEKLVHYNSKTNMRFLTGYSTGGWVALGLQIFYPDFFDGCWSYSPDPVDFEHFGLTNIYKDESMFYNEFGYITPSDRTIYGVIKRSIKDRIEAESLGSKTGNYLVSGGQFGAYNAAWGPRGEDGLPSLMFDPFTGKIDHSIAKQWEKYDLKKVLKKNWATLGPMLQGKIWVWTGDMDRIYSNVATRFLKAFLDTTTNPKSDAKILFTAMAGHMQEWSDKAALTMIGEKVAEMNRKNR
jgi:S-formylglutathione hydrolase FrmB